MKLTISEKRGSEINAGEWNDLVSSVDYAGLFLDYHFIDNITGGKWSAFLVRNGAEKLVGLFPFQQKKKYGISYFMQPTFCQYWGPVILGDEQNNTKKFAAYKKVITLIISTIKDKFNYASFNISPEFNYQLPFTWNNFASTNKFTYLIDLLENKADLYSKFSNDIRRTIEKNKQAGYTIENQGSLDEVLNLYQNEKPSSFNSIGKEAFGHLNETVNYFKSQKKCFLYTCKLNDELAAAMVFFKYKKRLYYFFGTTDSQHKGSGAMAAIIWQAIQDASDCDTFDFEGSILENLERFARSFNSYPQPYASITMNKLPFPLNYLYKLKS